MSDSRKLCAFSGIIGAGKDTSVDYLISKYGGVKMAFADPLYDIMYMAEDICGLEHYKDRIFLQLLGTEWGRAIDPQLWIKHGLSRIQKCKENIFFVGIRFQNEIQALRNCGFKIVRLVRNGDCIQSNEQTGDLLEYLKDEDILDSVLQYASRILNLDDYHLNYMSNAMKNHCENTQIVHSSETALSDSSDIWDIVIENNGSLQELYYQLDKL